MNPAYSKLEEPVIVNPDRFRPKAEEPYSIYRHVRAGSMGENCLYARHDRCQRKDCRCICHEPH
jgi:hypothetical protein